MANNMKKTNIKTKNKKKIQFANITQNIKKRKANHKPTDMNNTKSSASKRKVRSAVLIGIMSILIAIALCGLSFCVYIIIASPEFDVSKLYKSSSSILYDADNNVIAELGIQKRENVTYDELPGVLVDAIVATEDSKFFQHNGIDLLRFGKAVFGQLIGQSGAGGGSTLTMQVVKNTYTSKEIQGIEGIIRKFTDIYMAVFKVEKTYTKQEILEFYVNQGYLGSGAYGVQQASQVYFGKDVGQLNLSEAATIAGLFQAPTAYDPYVYPEKAQNRRDQVLGLLKRHGYITEKEEKAAKAMKIENMLTGNKSSASKYQGFIDTVVAEVYNRTGYDPAVVSMTIYTTLKQDKQNVINQLYDGTLYKWKNDVVQCGIAVTDVETGAIVAIGTGRNRNGERTYNYATSINRHPGSTAKPIFDYGPAIEYAGWGTGSFVMDDEYSYSNGTSINNVDRKYSGIMTAKRALAKSRNIPALQAFQATNNDEKVEFVTNLGITPELHDGQILESSSIGAFDGVSPLELSAAYGTFSRGGYYIEPYSFTKLVYNDTGETYSPTPTKYKAMSEETAYMINMMLKYAVTSGSIGAGYVSGTDIASKTGTSSVPNSTVSALHLSSSAIRDSWQIAYSPTYSIALWYGYDEITKTNYLTSSEGWSARSAITKALTTRIFEKNARWSKPNGVISVDIELETNPVQLASEFTPDALRSTEYYKKGTEPTEVSTRFARLDDVSNLTYTAVGNQVHLTWDPIDKPDAIDDNYLKNYFESGYTRWADKYYQQRLAYNAANIGTLEYNIYLENPDGSLTPVGHTSANNFTTTIVNTSNPTYVVKSSYSIFKNNASAGRKVTVKFSPSVTPPSEGDEEEDPDIE